MHWLRIYDAARTPSHWTEIIRPGQYAIFVFEARSHVARDCDARHFSAPDEVKIALCDSLAEASESAKGIVFAHGELCCEIYDHAGKANDPVETVYHPAERHKYEGRRYHKREVYLGGPAVAVGIVLVIFDYNRGFTWMWGYIIGLKLIMSGGFAMIRGLIGWYERRNEV